MDDAPPDKLRMKQALRAAALARRDAMSAAERARASDAVTVRALPIIETALAEGFSPVSAFLPIRSEIDPRQIVHRLAGRGIPLALPTVTFSGLVFRAWKPGELLRAAGFDDVLVDLGEVRVRGQRPTGGMWQAAIADPRDGQRTLFELPLGDSAGALPALATSAGAGTPLGPDPRIHHLFDPHTGRSANHYLSVSAAAPRATLADGLSTTLAVLAPSRAAALLEAYPAVRAYLVDADGRLQVRGSGRPQGFAERGATRGA